MSTELPPRLRQGVVGLGVAQLKSAATSGGPACQSFKASIEPLSHQHFGPVLVSCERGAVRPLPDALWVYADALRQRRTLDLPAVPRFEVIDECVAALRSGQAPLHDGRWARATIEVCLGLLRSAREQRDVEISRRDSP